MRTTTPIKAPWLSERVLQMEKNFMDLHYQGFSIPDIAKNLTSIKPPSIIICKTLLKQTAQLGKNF